MRDPERIERILTRISDIWHKYPDLRLGQLIANYVSESQIYHIEDENLIDVLENAYLKDRGNH